MAVRSMPLQRRGLKFAQVHPEILTKQSKIYLNGKLIDAGQTCDHHGEGHTCGDHEEGHGCGHHDAEENHSCGCGSHEGTESGEGCGCGCGERSKIEGANVGKTLKVHYTGTFNDGTKFDSSYDRGEPLEFVCGAGMMIKGFDRAVADMEIGQIKDIHLMPEEAYGLPDPNAIFHVEISQLPGAEETGRRTAGLPSE